MLKASWIITTKCNFHCSHCYLSCKSKDFQEVSLTSAKKIIGILKKLGVKLVFISGGEPLLHPHFFEISKLLHNNGVIISLCSNASLITDSIAKKLLACGVKDVSVGIESINLKKYQAFRGHTFESVVRGIDTCIRNGIRVSLDTTVTAYNFPDVWKIIDFGKKHHVEGIILKRFIPLGRGKENAGKFELSGTKYVNLLKKWLKLSLKEEKKGFYLLAHEPIFSVLINTKLKEIPFHLRTFSVGCRAGIISFGVYLDGNFTYCPIISKYHTVGNLLTMKLPKIKKVLEKNPVMSRELHLGNCGKCGFFAFCRGCHSHAFAVSGNMMKPDPLCYRSIISHGN